jgi:hypothetical protein
MAHLAPKDLSPNQLLEDVRRAVRDLKLQDLEKLLDGRSGLALLPFSAFLPNGLDGIRRLVAEKSESAYRIRGFIRGISLGLREKGLSTSIPNLRDRNPPELINTLFEAVLFKDIIGKAMRFDYTEKDHIPLRSIGVQLKYTGRWPDWIPDPATVPIITESPSEDALFEVELFCHKAGFVLAEGERFWIAQRLSENPKPRQSDIWKIASLVCDRFYSSKSHDKGNRSFSIAKRDILKIMAYLRQIAPTIYLQPTKVHVIVPIRVLPNLAPFYQGVQVMSDLLTSTVIGVDFSMPPKEHPQFDEIKAEVSVFERELQAKLADRVMLWQKRVESVCESYAEAQKTLFQETMHFWLAGIKKSNFFNPADFNSVAFNLDRLLDNALSYAVNTVNQQKGSVRLREQAGLDNYPTLFPEARQIQRRMIAHLGPTNSGKTHEAMQALLAAKDVQLVPSGRCGGDR